MLTSTSRALRVVFAAELTVVELLAVVAPYGLADERPGVEPFVVDGHDCRWVDVECENHSGCWFLLALDTTENSAG